MENEKLGMRNGEWEMKMGYGEWRMRNRG